MKRLIISAIVLLLSIYSNAQNIAIRGYIREQTSKEALVYATCIDTVSKNYCVSNAQGYYNIKLPKGKCSLQFNYVGYMPVTLSFVLTKDTTINAELLSVQLNEVAVIAHSLPNYEQVFLGKNTVEIQTIKSIPTISGIPDLNKALSYLPGVSLGKEGMSDLFVRGGDVGQNLFYFDGVKLYQNTRFSGFISLVNTESIQYVDLYKGGFPARYGGKLSSVIDIYTKQGSVDKKFKLTLGTLENSIILENSICDSSYSYILAARGSYYNFVQLNELLSYYKQENPYLFYLNLGDLHFKLNKQLKRIKGNVFFNTLHSIDYIYSKDDYPYSEDPSSYINQYKSALHLYQIKYSQTISNKFYLNASLHFSENTRATKDQIISWQSEPNTNTNNSKINTTNIFESSIKEYGIGINMDFLEGDKHNIKFGIQSSLYFYNPSIQTFTQYNDTSVIVDNLSIGYTNDLYSLENALFFEDDYKITEKINSNFGIRLVSYKSANYNQKYIEPRISFRWKFIDKWSFNWSISKMNQFHHSLLKNINGMISEIWLGATKNLPPEHAWQTSIGFFGQIGILNLSMESYIKNMTNLTYYQPFINEFIDENNIESRVTSGGIGRSYGIEFSTNINQKKYNLSINYALSRSTRTFKNLNSGITFPFRFDRPHDLSVLLNYIFNKKYSFNANFLLASGTPMSIPLSTTKDNYFFKGYFNYGGINNVRLPIYHRLDVAFSKMWQSKKKKYDNKINLSILNVYAHQNPVYIFYDSNSGKLYQKTLFSIFPTISYSINLH